MLLVTGPQAIEKSSRVVERIISALGDYIVSDGHRLTANASVGVAIFPDDATDGEQLICNADAAHRQVIATNAAPTRLRRRLRFPCKAWVCLYAASNPGRASIRDCRASAPRKDTSTRRFAGMAVGLCACPFCAGCTGFVLLERYRIHSAGQTAYEIT